MNARVLDLPDVLYGELARYGDACRATLSVEESNPKANGEADDRAHPNADLAAISDERLGFTDPDPDEDSCLVSPWIHRHSDSSPQPESPYRYLGDAVRRVMGAGDDVRTHYSDRSGMLCQDRLQRVPSDDRPGSANTSSATPFRKETSCVTDK